MVIDEATRSSAPEVDSPEKALADDTPVGDDIALGNDVAADP